MARLPLKNGVTWPDGTVQDDAIPSIFGNAKRFSFDNTASSPPPESSIRFNASFSSGYDSVTEIYMDAFDFYAADVLGWPETFETGGRLYINDPFDPLRWVLFEITGTITFGSGFYTIPVAHIGDSNAQQTSATTGKCVVAYDAVGTGTGGGDASTNTSTSVDSEIALFSGTGGKTLKRATGTGYAAVDSGVLDVLSGATLKSELSLNNVDNTSDASKNAATATLTDKRVTPRVGTVASSATPTINTDNVDAFTITALAVNITSMTTNLSGTPTDMQKLWIVITGTATRTITWGASFEASSVPLPTATIGTATLDVGFRWNPATNKWRCVAVA